MVLQRELRRWRILCLVGVLVAGWVTPASAAVFLDDFSDGDALLNSAGTVVGDESASTALGSWRAFTYYNSYLSGTFSLDQSNDSRFRLTSTGLGQVSLGYGMRLGPSSNSLEGGLTSALNANLSGYSGLRFHILENSLGKMRLTVTLRDTAGRYNHVRELIVSDVRSGAFDLPFVDLPETGGGGVNLADVDFITVTVYNGWVGHTVALDSIELVAVPEPTAITAILGLGALFLRVRKR